MTMAATDYPTVNRHLSRPVAGFIAGFLGVLIFHQLMLGLLHLIGLTAGQPFSMRPIPPFGLPAVLSSAFWGGVWGIVFAMVHQRFPRGSAYWVAAFLFGAIFPTLVSWFIVLPMKGMPVGNGWQPAGMLTGFLVNGAWGLGTGFFLSRLPRISRTSRSGI
jgi:phosphotransferase system  glucose/maltose/N-acetylglucosamine-specific IIC component